jgi:hypothetical protein
MEMVVFRKGGKVVRKDCIQIEEDRTKTALPYSSDHSSDFRYIILITRQRKDNCNNTSHAKWKKYRAVICKHGSEAALTENVPSFDLWL